MSMQILKVRKLEDRLLFLRNLLTQERVDEKIDHYHRNLLTEEVQELEVALNELPPSGRIDSCEHEYA
jgi:transcriptional regulator of NAD metabolism